MNQPLFSALELQITPLSYFFFSIFVFLNHIENVNFKAVQRFFVLGRDWKFILDIFSFNTQSIQNSLDLEKKLIRHFLKIVILKLWFLDISQHFKLIELGLKITLFFTQPHFSALYLPITPKSYFFSSYLCSYIIFRLFRTNLKALKRIFFFKGL